MENADGVPVGVNKLIVAYSRPLNLKNRFSVRDIHGRGRPASGLGILGRVEAGTPTFFGMRVLRIPKREECDLFPYVPLGTTRSNVRT
eukprot:scaffold13295_cov36-Cyclotella_meneghiniana.AAC.3